jgi:hypothetical protein
MILHITEIDPKNLLFERFKDVVFEGNTGNGPSNWFELKSVPMYRGYSDDRFGNIPLIWLLERFKKDK